jgi:hypothetical protein
MIGCTRKQTPAGLARLLRFQGNVMGRLTGKKLAALFKEMREDEAAGKREDAHWYGNVSSEKIQQSDAFDRMAADPGKEWSAVGFGALSSWENVSAASKVAFIASYAAVYDVPFERFEKAAKDAIVGQELDGEWTLQGQYLGAMTLVGPPVDPMADRFQKILDGQTETPAAEKGKDRGIER